MAGEAWPSRLLTVTTSKPLSTKKGLPFSVEQVPALIEALERVGAPPSGPWWTAVNPIPAKSRAVAGISKAMGLRAGTPDIVMCWKGRLVGIELKAGRGRLSLAQIETHDAITLAGVIVTMYRTLHEVAAFRATLGVPSRIIVS